MASEITIVIIVGGLSFILLGGIGLVLLYRNTIRRRALLKKTKGRLNYAKVVTTQEFINGQQAEQKRLASEIHDGIGNQLAILKILISDLSIPEEGKKQQIELAIGNAIKTIRTYSAQLDRGIFDGERLRNALQTVIDQIAGLENITINYQTYGLVELQDNNLCFLVLKTIEEAISNTLKYARAKTIDVEINYFKDEYLNILYKDDGVGFRAAEVTEGYGLRSIREKTSAVNGSFFLRTEPGKGTEINLKIPAT